MAEAKGKIEIEVWTGSGAGLQQRPLLLESNEDMVLGIRFTFANGRSVIARIADHLPELEIKTENSDLAVFGTGGQNVLTVRPISYAERRLVN